MSFIEKLDMLMAEKHINKSTLSKEAGIPYTTIAVSYTHLDVYKRQLPDCLDAGPLCRQIKTTDAREER